MAEIDEDDVCEGVKRLSEVADIYWHDNGDLIRRIRSMPKDDADAPRELTALRDLLNEVLGDG